MFKRLILSVLLTLSLVITPVSTYAEALTDGDFSDKEEVLSDAAEKIVEDEAQAEDYDLGSVSHSDEPEIDQEIDDTAEVFITDEQLEKGIDAAGNKTTYISEEPEAHYSKIPFDTRYAAWGTKDMLAKADAEARRLVGELVNDSMSDIEKAFVLAQYLNENVVYGYDKAEWRGQTAYEALILHKSVCAGNAAAYNMLTYYAGLNTIYVCSNQACHAWVEMELDGQWYFVDAQNCCAFDSFIMAKNTYSDYNMPDIETYEDWAHDPYDYLHSVQPCTDSTFEGIDFRAKKITRVEGNTTYYKNAMDWPTFKANLARAGININNYKSTRVSAIKATYTGTKTLYEGDSVSKSDFNVKAYLRQYNPDGSYLESAAETISSSKFTVSPTSLVVGENVLTITAETSQGLTLSCSVKITALKDELVSTVLNSIKAELTVDEVFAGRDPKQYIVVTPTYLNNYRSGRLVTIEGDPVDDFVCAGQIRPGSNIIKVSYTCNEVTKSVDLIIKGVLPSVTKIEPIVKEKKYPNGATILLDTKNQAEIETTAGDRLYADVVWEKITDKYDPDRSDAQSFKVTGTVVLPSTVDNKNGISNAVSMLITVDEASEQLDISADRASGSYDRSFLLTLDSAENASIYYSIDGSKYAEYVNPLVIRGKTNSEIQHSVKAYAHKRGYKNSKTVELDFTLSIGDEDEGLKDIMIVKNLVKGEKFNVLDDYPEFEPALLKLEGIRIASDNKKIAAVNAKGIVTGKSAGKTTISVYKGTELLGSYDVTVELPYFPQKKYYVIAGGTIDVVLAGTQQSVEYEIAPSSNMPAYMDGSTLFARKKGTVKLMAKVHGKVYKTTVVVEEPRISKEYLAMNSGKLAKLKVTGTKQKVDRWESSDESVAAVEGGTVIAYSGGKTVITAYIGDNAYSCDVFVY